MSLLINLVDPVILHVRQEKVREWSLQRWTQPYVYSAFDRMSIQGTAIRCRIDDKLFAPLARVTQLTGSQGQMLRQRYSAYEIRHS